MFKYLAQLDGLRAISIILVILYHYKIPFFDFGYLGVDIFFVISGFLITGLLLNNKNLYSNKINFFISFILRRFLRLFPNLFIVVILSYFLAFFLIPAGNFKDFAQSAGSSLFFISNFLFYLETGYFDQSSNFKPLLHTWSLSVEFQFYIIFSLIAIFLFRLNEKLIFFTSTLIVILSIIFLFYLNTSKDLLFYLTQFRLWEILTGSISYFLFNKVNEKYKYSIIPLLIIISIFIAAIFILKFYNFFNLSLVLFVFLTFIFLIFSNNFHIVNFFSIPFLVYFGKISYGLYLFHYPIYVFCNYYFLNELSYFVKFCCFLISLILSIFSYNFIEKASKKRSNFFHIKLSGILIFFSFLISFFSLYIHYNKDLYSRYKTINLFKKFEIPQNLNLIKDFNQNPYLSYDDKNINCHSDKLVNISCDINFGENKKKYLLIGDSYAGNFSSIYNKWIRINNFYGQQYTIGGCDLLSFKTECEDYKKFILNLIKTNKFDTIIFSIKWKKNNDIDDKKKYFDNISKLIDQISNSSENVYILSPRVELIFSPQNYMLSPNYNKNLETNNLLLHRKNFSLIYNFFENLNYKKINFVDTNVFFCNDKNCDIFSKEVIFYKDKFHFTKKGSEIIFKNIFNK